MLTKITLWEQGQFATNDDEWICIQIISSNNLDNYTEKICRNQLGLIYRDLGERPKQEFEKGIVYCSEKRMIIQTFNLD